MVSEWSFSLNPLNRTHLRVTNQILAYLFCRIDGQRHKVMEKDNTKLGRHLQRPQRNKCYPSIWEELRSHFRTKCSPQFETHANPSQGSAQISYKHWSSRAFSKGVFTPALLIKLQFVLKHLCGEKQQTLVCLKTSVWAQLKLTLVHLKCISKCQMDRRPPVGEMSHGTLLKRRNLTAENWPKPGYQQALIPNTVPNLQHSGYKIK